VTRNAVDVAVMGLCTLSVTTTDSRSAPRQDQNGDKSSLTGKRRLSLTDKVPIGVLIAEPTTPQQQDVFDEATEVFHSLEATVYGQDDAHRLASNVSHLLGAA
jgi:hypothetical protein